MYNDITNETEELSVEFLNSIAKKKEFSVYREIKYLEDTEHLKGFNLTDHDESLFIGGLKLTGEQSFVRNFNNINTKYKSLLVEWQTGTGKTIAVCVIANEFIRYYKMKTLMGARSPTVYVITFLKEIVLADLLKFPEFGFITQDEIDGMNDLLTASNGNPNSVEYKQYTTLLSIYRRRISDKSRGGYYKFFGYREFATQIFLITTYGMSQKFDVHDLYSKHDDNMTERIQDAINKKYIVVNYTLINQIKGGLLICDEIQNVYNMQEKNNYGIAIQYVLDYLGKEAPRSVFMSYTPMTGSASEIVDLMNLLVPKHELPNQQAIKRSDLFSKTLYSNSNSETNASSTANSDEDLFEEEVDESFVVSQLKPGAAEFITKYTLGRVSYLLDADVAAYPKMIFTGESIDNISYLKFIKCPMSKFHEQTLQFEQTGKQESSGLSATAYTLYDLVFPNPNTDELGTGLYKSNDTMIKLINSEKHWRQEIGLSIEKDSMSGVNVVSGQFLKLENVKKYSSKYHKMMSDVLDLIKSGDCGKIMIYHHRVRMSGVLFIQELLKENNIIDMQSLPTDNTICSRCGVQRSQHNDPMYQSKVIEVHDYVPTRFIMAHSDLDKMDMLRGIDLYKSTQNKFGDQYTILVGSKILKEGYNFNCIRHMKIMALPSNIPTFLQVIGRGNRKNSHILLPIEERNLEVQIYVSTFSDNRLSPELKRYRDKMAEYLVIQKVDQALHIGAVDSYNNYEKIKKTLMVDNPNFDPTLRALPYTPLTLIQNISELDVSTFNAYMYSSKEISNIILVCRKLFRIRPVWTYEDLWNAVKTNIFKDLVYDMTIVKEGNFILALKELEKPIEISKGRIYGIYRAGKYYIFTEVTPDDKKPLFDIECYIRNYEFTYKKSKFFTQSVIVNVSDYVQTNLFEQNFKFKLEEFNKKYIFDNEYPLELALVDYDSTFHYTLIRRFIEDDAKYEKPPAKTADDLRVKLLYLRFRICLTEDDLDLEELKTKLTKVFHATNIRKYKREGGEPSMIGYINNQSISVYDRASKQWTELPHSTLNIGKRYEENNIMVGIVTPSKGDKSTISNSAQNDTRFRLRIPIHIIKGQKHTDKRLIDRGAVCETKKKHELETCATKLRIKLYEMGIKIKALDNIRTKHGGDFIERFYDLLEKFKMSSNSYSKNRDQDDDNDVITDIIKFNREFKSNLSYASKFDKIIQERYPHTTELCGLIKIQLLALEEHERARAKGMSNGLRWLYLFNDNPPDVVNILTN